MCEYCESDKVIFEEEMTVLRGIGPVGEGGYLDKEKLFFMYDDRGYLRVVNDDYGCLDHGQNVKANFCFNCGRNLNDILLEG